MKTGYKLTDIGAFPEEWSIDFLGKHASFRTGPFGSSLHKSDYTIDGIPIVNPMHIVDGKIIPTRTMTITKEAAELLSEFRVYPGEVVIGRRGDMGRCAVVEDQHTGWMCGTGSMIIRPRRIDASFLQRVLSSPRAVSAIRDSSVGTTMVNLNQATLARLKVPIPPLAEQRAIAEALGDVDALLNGLDRLIAKKLDLKQAAMQQLLTGQTRLPGFTGQWDVKRLGDGIALHSGHHILAQYCNSRAEGTPYLTGPADFPDGHIQQTKFTTRPSTICAPGDILVTVKGSGSGTIVLADAAYCISRQLMSISVTDWDVRFTYYSIRQNAEQFRAGSSGLIPGLSRSDILEQLLPMPPTVAEQTAIAAVLSDMDAEISALEARRNKTRDLKQAMMQELLTGRIRLV